ncbi:unnamed protein product [Adineta steineri]|uniref:Ubiquitin carboxyl-terminal hydrolase n=1 Tax=Adineta steineri TaxID=433720 RepID=A0A818G165_9BILA|nr:unnamed protein product [Adineta steineri]
MGKGHKERRREKRAVEVGERDQDERILKQELEEENEKKIEEQQALKKEKEQQVNNEKLIETSSDTDSGHGSSIATSTNSPKVSKSSQQDESIENQKRRTLIKGLINIGNTCFFNVVIQSLAHTPLLIDTMYQTIRILMNENEKKYSSTTTAQLMNVFDEFTSTEKKKPSIDPKLLFNSLIQRIPLYKGYDQHDTHELFMNLMSILRAEENQLKHLQSKPSNHSDNDDDPSKMFCLIGCNEPYTIYDSIFSGHLLDVITCKKCEKSLMKIEPFLGLLLPLTDRMTPGENYRNRRKRDDYTGTKPKKETKILSRKQQKALQKQEKKNSRRSAGTSTGKIKGRQAAKKKTVEEQLPLDESSPLPTTEETIVKNEENENKESSDVKTDKSDHEKAEEEEQQEQSIVENNEGEEQEQPTVENKEEEEQADEESEDDDEEESKGPLTAVESTCMLSDMVSKLTLIHETASRPLPFVDENLAQKFLNCHKTVKNSSVPDETDNIKTLEQCFQRYFKPETLSGENLFDCYYCRSVDKTQKKVLTEATRQTVFFQLPPILPVFLKRFQMYGSHSEKINRFIEFPLQLDLTDRCSAQITTTSSIYTLYAVIEHSGTLRSGHYIAYIKQSMNDIDLLNKHYSKPIDYVLANLFKSTTDNSCEINNSTTESDPSSPPSSWYHISDNTIHKVPENKVLEADAYVLFYRRI